MKPGDVITVMVGGKEYETIVDQYGFQRFRTNKLFCHLVDSQAVDLCDLIGAFHNGEFTQEEYLLFIMGLGYSVCGLSELPQFVDLEIENPARTTDPKTDCGK